MIHLSDEQSTEILTKADLELIQSELHAAFENAQRTLERAEMLLLRLALRRKEKAANDVADSSLAESSDVRPASRGSCARRS
ncbi:MAG TPA: hypothetical protein VK843_19085 [Planctomycetota bacterium]|nr:hypothetical protein [Planctomycetota bacterium]